MIEIVTTPPPNWDELSKTFNVKWEGNVVVTYGGIIHCPSGKVAPDVLVHEMVHVEQQKGEDMDILIHRYMTDREYLKRVETEAFTAQQAFIDATMSPDRAWCYKYRIAKMMADRYKGIFTMETASAIMKV
jgi:hypothetical protein